MNNRSPPGNQIPTRTEVGEETVDLPEGTGFFNTGQVLGDRYEILEMLGRGGMGEVWRAFDLKLRVEVGLKALREELFQSERRLELLRQEVRAAREVVSPNVCRIFDLIEIDGRELVSMEYVDGATLLGVLQERGPLELKEAQDIASQFLAGLEAIHRAGLVHRDVKPENIMLTRAGRVVVMDFGLARGPESGAGSVSGTPAYMAPEHAAGQDVDARADVYSAGVVLAEMVSPDGIKSYESRQSVWEGVRSEPAQVPDSPWASVIQRAVARDRERRPNSAHTLIRELEDVTLRVEGSEDLHPYPGLASFTEDDAEFFFGREAEVEQMWRQLERPHLLAVVGPSGAGKTSFLRAGLIPSVGPGWGILRCTPGSSPFTSLGQALAREMAGDVEAMELLASGHEQNTLVQAISLWRHRFDHGVLIADQFEELFTHSSNEEERRFTDLMGRLPVEADTFVLLSMRDDFLLRCREHEALTPIFTDLTALLPPTGGSLRRSIVQPATKCGYRFEDDKLVEEILTEVEGERGALPLLAFALARLWEKRDRESGLLTRQAYHDIGGVGGALARHAEATVDRIGVERIPIVRELFRNLVTAEGTRAVREWSDLLSVFEDSGREGVKPFPTKITDNAPVGAGITPARDAASEVLSELIDARLLTSYEVREDEHEPIRRVEIIHESLLANWPRLVRWQTQDQEGAQLRDELRQSARAWKEHGRHDDRLWTGTAYREFQLWQERYPGGLTEMEEDFASAMVSLATRRKRRRRVTATAAIVLFALVAVVFAGLWRQGVVERRRGEAQKLIALGQLRLQDYPTAALARATASLELADSVEARHLALQALWEGPTAFVVNETPSLRVSFSSDGQWLVQSHDSMSSLAVISRAGDQLFLDHPTDSGSTRVEAFFFGDDDLFVSRGQATDKDRFALWSASEGRLLVSAKPLEAFERMQVVVDANEENPRGLLMLGKGNLITIEALNTDGSYQRLGEYRSSTSVDQGFGCISDTGEWFTVLDGDEVYVVGIDTDGLAERRLVGRHEGRSPFCRADPLGRFFLTFSRSGGIRRWDPSGDLAPLDFDTPPVMFPYWLSKEGNLVVLTEPEGSARSAQVWLVNETGVTLLRRFENRDFLDYDSVRQRLVMRGPLPAHRLWSLADPAGAKPLVIRGGPVGYSHVPGFSPDGRWLATNDYGGLTMWPLAREYAAVIGVDFKPWSVGLEFGPDGQFLATSARSEVRVWPLEGPVPSEGHIVFEAQEDSGDGPGAFRVTVSPDGEWFAVGNGLGNEVWICRNGEKPRQLRGDTGLNRNTGSVSFSPDSRFVAAMDGAFDLAHAAWHVWDVATGDEVAALRLDGEELRKFSRFVTDGRLLTGSNAGVVAWDVETGEYEVLVKARLHQAAASENGRRLLITKEEESVVTDDPAGSPLFFDLDTGHVMALDSHGLHVRAMSLDREGNIAVTGDPNGIIRVGPVTGREPHLLLGHDKAILKLAVDPLGRWIASASMDGTMRIWPMPDLSKPPLHTLPREELIAKLKTLTNLRVVRDPESATGWTLTHDPFPGWETVPTW